MRVIYLLPILTLTLILACGGDSVESEALAEAPAVTADTLDTQPVRPELAAGETLTAWVDGLFVRAQPEKNGTIVSQVRSDAPLEYTGKRSDAEETIVLRGMAFAEPWLQVRTADGQEGWVFGGAVQRPGEAKGLGYQTEMQFDFPEFGAFDLRDWSAEAPYETGGGDAATTLTVFQDSNRRLAIKRTDIGEQGYERLYTLTNAGGKLLKTREFVVRTDPSPRITETVTDYTANPQRVYTRSQELSKHFMQLNALPEIATGEWNSGSGK